MLRRSMILVTMLLICFVSVSAEQFTIVIDAGHGGKDGGTFYNDIYEKDINLSIVLKLKKELNKHGVDVLLTRDDDYDLSSPDANRRKKSDFDNRIRFINDNNADLYLSIHVNYLSDSKYYGAQVFYTDENKQLASVIQNEFNNKLNSPMKEKKLNNSIYMYKQLNVPGVLVEVGFMSNAKERNLLVSDSYQNRIVNCLVHALIKYY